jgi:2-oxoglutarate ferredoxin oxidoreductase subunit beta
MYNRPVFIRPRALKPVPFHFCPGCHHGIIHRLVAEAIDHFNIVERTIGIAPVGCAVFAYDYFACDILEVAHGRPPAACTGIKRARPDLIVFSYQGDGDLASIGTAEIIHAANRGENITVIFVNNAIYGMTGGQMAPTTLLAQKTKTTPRGRDARTDGYPLRVCELLATLEGTTYIERVSVNTPLQVKKAGMAIKKGFKCQIENKGFSLIEVLSACPTNWGMEPVQANEWIETEMQKVFPLGVYKDSLEEKTREGKSQHDL